MIEITHDIHIDEDELTFRASRSAGPGGQNVNKVNTRIKLLFDVTGSSSLSDRQKQKINRYALGKVGAKYDFLGIVGFLLKIVLGLRFNPLASDERLFCSEFIARAFGKAHIQLTPNAPQLTSPEDPLAINISTIQDVESMPVPFLF